MSSSLVDALARHREDADPACPPADLRTLAQIRDEVPDPRRVHGCRYRIGSLLALCLVAVLGGAKSVTAIASSSAAQSATPRCSSSSSTVTSSRRSATPPSRGMGVWKRSCARLRPRASRSLRPDPMS
ncbi:transposase family protein [Streptomyces sp. N2-109]|uniref:Transposase family protein n=1 Tax=Streptomyces gossypii TaxID=2883101 RepID=A0ABT2JU89_9ACTN|nr:transposase family protein [Streptomyces gossypii]